MPGFSYRAPQAEKTSPSVILAARKAVKRVTSRLSFRDLDSDEDEHFVDDDAAAATAATAEAAHGHGHEKNQGWGRGIRSDFRRTVRRHWLSELTNLNTKTIAVSFFLFIAVIAPSITFGAVYAKRTNNYIGASELLLGTAWCGIFYSLVSGQVSSTLLHMAHGPWHGMCYFLYTELTQLLIFFLLSRPAHDDQRSHWTCADLPSRHI